MATLNGVVYAFGGQAWLDRWGPFDQREAEAIDSVEVWDMNKETWRALDVKMAMARSYMAALVVDPKKLFHASWSGSGSDSGDGDGIGIGSGTGAYYGSESGLCKP